MIYGLVCRCKINFKLTRCNVAKFDSVPSFIRNDDERRSNWWTMHFQVDSIMSAAITDNKEIRCWLNDEVNFLGCSEYLLRMLLGCTYFPLKIIFKITELLTDFQYLVELIFHSKSNLNLDKNIWLFAKEVPISKCYIHAMISNYLRISYYWYINGFPTSPVIDPYFTVLVLVYVCLIQPI